MLFVYSIKSSEFQFYTQPSSSDGQQEPDQISTIAHANIIPNLSDQENPCPRSLTSHIDSEQGANQKIQQIYHDSINTNNTHHDQSTDASKTFLFSHEEEMLTQIQSDFSQPSPVGNTSKKRKRGSRKPTKRIFKPIAWTVYDNVKLLRLVSTFGDRRPNLEEWGRIGKQCGGHSALECRKHFYSFNQTKCQDWTKDQESKLVDLLRIFGDNPSDENWVLIARQCTHSVDACKRKLSLLLAGPITINKLAPWTEDQVSKLLELTKNFEKNSTCPKWRYIARQCGHSASACQTKFHRLMDETSNIESIVQQSGHSGQKAASCSKSDG